MQTEEKKFYLNIYSYILWADELISQYLDQGYYSDIVLRNISDKKLFWRLNFQLLCLDILSLRHKALLFTLFYKNAEQASLVLLFCHAMEGIKNGNKPITLATLKAIMKIRG